MQKGALTFIILWIEASLFMQTSIEGGSIDKEFTEVAVIACLSPFEIAEITFTVEAIPRIEVKKLFFNSGSSI